MAFLRIIQKMSNIAYESSEIKKLPQKLKNTVMTQNELVEYLERTLSSYKSDVRNIENETNALLVHGNLNPRQKVDLQWSLVHLRNQAEMLEFAMNAHIKGFKLAKDNS